MLFILAFNVVPYTKYFHGTHIVYTFLINLSLNVDLSMKILKDSFHEFLFLLPSSVPSLRFIGRKRLDTHTTYAISNARSVSFFAPAA